MNFRDRLRAVAEAKQEEFMSRPAATPRIYAGRATRNDFLKWVYAQGLVRADSFSAHAADKLFFAKLLEAYAPLAYVRFHPRTFSLAELGDDPSLFLKDREVIAKPAAGMNGEGGRVYPSTYEFLAYLKTEPERFGDGPEASPLTGLLSSGERYLVQEKVKGRGPEIRLHTFEDKVVKGATFTRWDEAWNPGVFAAAEAAAQGFLDLLPAWVTYGQAWSIDLMAGPEGYKIIEVNTNRGRPGQWSGDLSLPDVLQAYSRHLAARGLDFSREGGPALLAGEGNLEKFVGKFGQEAWDRHQALRQKGAEGVHG